MSIFNIKTIYITPVVLLAISTNVLAQNHRFEWAKKTDTTSLSHAITLDHNQNLYTAGSMGTGSGTTAVMHKQDAAGNFIWTKYITAEVVCRITSMHTNPENDIFIAGYFKGKTDFDPGADSVYMTSASTNNDGFILKIDAAGNFKWIRQIGGGDNYEIQAIRTDTRGNIYTTGRFAGRTDFNPGADSFYLSTTPATQSDVFIHKLDSSGNYLWAKSFEGNSNGHDQGSSIAIDKEENVFVTGHFRGTLDFNPGLLGYPMSAQGGVDAFIVKLNDTGGFAWARQIAGTNGQEGISLVADDSGHVYTTGCFEGATNFDLNGSNVSITAVGNYDAFITRHNPAGDLLWVKQIGGKGRQIGYGIDLDADRNVYTTGIFADTTDLNPGADIFHLTTTGAGTTDVYISKLNHNGDFIWGKGIGGAKSEDVSGIRVDNSRNIYAVGVVRSDSADFDPDTASSYYLYVPPLPPPFGSFFPNNQLFTLKLQCADTTSSYISPEACYSYEYNGTTYTQSGIYTHRFPNAAGCDSTVNLALTIHPLPQPLISVNETELSTTEPYSAYRWLLDGDTIPNATERKYIVTENGSYRVVVTNENGCTDTSGTYTVSNVSVGHYGNFEDKISISPNPASGIVYVKAPIAVHIILTGVDGKLIKTAKNTTSLSVAELNNGIYMLRITDTNNNLLKVEKLIRNN